MLFTFIFSTFMKHVRFYKLFKLYFTKLFNFAIKKILIIKRKSTTSISKFTNIIFFCVTKLFYLKFIPSAKINIPSVFIIEMKAFEQKLLVITYRLKVFINLLKICKKPYSGKLNMFH